MKHTFGMKEAMESDMVPPDDWGIHEWDSLHELGFESDGRFKMCFEHTDEVEGEEKTLTVVVYKKKDGWYLEHEKNKNKQPTLRFKQNGALVNKIHDIFENF
jgi:hypothetical protein